MEIDEEIIRVLHEIEQTDPARRAEILAQFMERRQSDSRAELQELFASMLEQVDKMEKRLVRILDQTGGTTRKPVQES